MAMREYEKRQERNGEQPKHEFAKEMLAGIASAEVDKYVFILVPLQPYLRNPLTPH